MKATDYGPRIAYHYAAFRPPLHRLALKRAFQANEHFRLGLDVGCGTGYSTAALKDWCDQVVGIDPNPAMLAHAQAIDGVSYQAGHGDDIPLHQGSVDVVTFAGSLLYALSPLLMKELSRVARGQAVAVVYDFEVQLDEGLSALQISVPPSDYDHAVNLHGVEEAREVVVTHEEVVLGLTPEQLAHVLLSCPERYQRLALRFADDEIWNPLVTALKALSIPAVRARLYYSRYEIAGLA